MSRILVIDDDTSLLQMISLILQRAGHTPILATHGQEGIELAVNEQPDLAVVDIMMPDLSGYEVCRRLREDPRTSHIPLLVLTALVQYEDRERAADSGADGYVTKPITSADLVSAVDELLTTGARNIPSPLETPSPPPSRPTLDEIEEPVYPSPSFEPVSEATLAPVHLLPLIAVMGLRGGVGTTTVAVNLGLGLIDLSPGGDKRRIGAALAMGHRSGLAVLAAPPRPVQERLPSPTLSYVFDVLSEGFKRIVVDLPDAFNNMSVTALQHARYIVLVVGDDPAGLATAPSSLSALEELGLAGEKLIVLNRSRPHGVSSQEVIQALNCPLAAELPYEPAQVAALTQGVPLVMSQPRSLYAQAVMQLAKTL